MKQTFSARVWPEGVAIVPHHNSDVKLGTLRSILNQAGLTSEEFENL